MKRGDKSKSDMRAIRHFPTIHEDILSVVDAFNRSKEEFKKIAEMVRTLPEKSRGNALKQIEKQLKGCLDILLEAKDQNSRLIDLEKVLRSFLGDSLPHPDEDDCSYVESLCLISNKSDRRVRISDLQELAKKARGDYDKVVEKIRLLEERSKLSRGTADSGIKNENRVARKFLEQFEAKRNAKADLIRDAVMKVEDECDKVAAQCDAIKKELEDTKRRVRVYVA